MPQRKLPTKRMLLGQSPCSMVPPRDALSSSMSSTHRSLLRTLRQQQLPQGIRVREYYLNGLRILPQVLVRVTIADQRSEARTLAGQLVREYTSIEFQAIQRRSLGRQVPLEDLLFIGHHTIRGWWLRWDRNDCRLLSPKQKVALLQETDGIIPRSTAKVKELLIKLDLLTDQEIGHTFNGHNRLVEMIPPEKLEALESFLLRSSKG